MTAPSLYTRVNLAEKGYMTLVASIKPLPRGSA